MQTDTDVVVVGARLAGAATAMLLARQGLRVTLVERAQALGDTVSTHAFMRAGVLQLHRWGLLDKVRAAGTPPVHFTTFRYADAIVPIALEAAHGVDALYAPRRTVVDRILVDAAVAAGVDVRYGHRVTGLLRRTFGRTGGITGVRGAGEPFAISSDFVVGADGISSSIARLVHAPIEHRARHATAITYGYWSDVPVSGYEWIFQANAAAGVVPTNAGQVCVFANATPERIGRGGTDVIESIMSASAPEIAELLRGGRAPARTRTFRAPRGYLRRAWGDGWALVGDAGYFKDPITAHGMTDALRDAELLALALTSGDEAKALAEYQGVRDELSLPLFRVADAVASHQWTNAEIAGLLKALSSSMRDEVRLLTGLEPGRSREQAA